MSLVEPDNSESLSLLEAVTLLEQYSHRTPPSESELAAVRRLADEAAKAEVRTLLSDSLPDLEAFREIHLELQTVRMSNNE